ncbi:putative ribosome biogenesis GTPase RsgA [Lysobacter xinjiangensis]|uniref:Small ribosomal subunit biogenesis GTPase RsgA n=1 Tax=Cognatilysobacter xinjiangensis TaxID=546892 RepID=A0ABQ3C4I8_9GAMM|nr:ribosome small subunit-dependent GTPase A [Lysobacter xinjiangensis]GGZ63772.1 putative ribosome biogenesis GTPase RsgA [Lysobacter xinjiangensis]
MSDSTATTAAALDARQLGRIGWPGVADDWAALFAAHPQARPARVIEQHRTGYVVAEGPGEGYGVESLPDWARPAGYRAGRTDPTERPGVGDWLLVEGTGASAKAVALLPRHSAIKRAAAGEHYKQQLIAANIDTAFVVSGLDGDFNPRRIERYLLLVHGGGVQPVIVLTKADVAGAATIEDARDALADVVEDVEIVVVNAREAASVAQLDRWLGPGRTAVLVGSSGAGKSTLTNTLLGIERMKTASVRENDSRGRHTTTHRALIPLPQGGCLIDTPGMRELKPTGEEAVADTFADVEALAAQCRFRDCSHEAEPGCAVRAAIESGELDPQRLANYRKLAVEVAGAAGRLATRQQQKADSKPGGRPSGRRPDGRGGRR